MNEWTLPLPHGPLHNWHPSVWRALPVPVYIVSLCHVLSAAVSQLLLHRDRIWICGHQYFPSVAQTFDNEFHCYNKNEYRFFGYEITLSVNRLPYIMHVLSQLLGVFRYRRSIYTWIKRDGEERAKSISEVFHVISFYTETWHTVRCALLNETHCRLSTGLRFWNPDVRICVGRYSVVGITTRWGLDTAGI